MSSELGRKVLVPVDGSELAERIVAFAERVARESKGEVKLVRVVTNARVKEALRGDDGKDVFASARGYLEYLVTRLHDAGIRASSALMIGDPAEQILDLAESWEPSLVAMSTHGRTGVERWIRGSVAERVLRECRFPLLLANPFALATAATSRSFRRILVPLDGSARAAGILPLVRQIATVQKSEVILFESTRRPGATTTAEDSLRAHGEAREALEALALELEGVKSRVVTTSRVPASAILAAIKKEDVDLVAMTTHGRSGLGRWIFGSVAENVLRECRCPLLVVRSVEGARPSRATRRAKKRATRASAAR